MCSKYEKELFYRSLLKTNIIRSAIEYEFIALDKAREEVEWLHSSRGHTMLAKTHVHNKYTL